MKENIYIIDDNYAIGDALKFLLESFKYKVTFYQNALSFLQQDIAQLPGCVIVDLYMPQMNGFELIKRLRMINCHIKIIVISGNGSYDTENRAMKDGAHFFFSKPFNTKDLINALSTLFAEQKKLS